MRRYFVLYLLVLTMPVFLSLLVWQSNRYENLSRELLRLEQSQEEWIESNKRLIADIAEYSSPGRIEQVAKYQLEMQKIRPEHLLQVKITGGEGNGL